jgi:hypothetical protein
MMLRLPKMSSFDTITLPDKTGRRVTQHLLQEDKRSLFKRGFFVLQAMQKSRKLGRLYTRNKGKRSKKSKYFSIIPLLLELQRKLPFQYSTIRVTSQEKQKSMTMG